MPLARLTRPSRYWQLREPTIDPEEVAPEHINTPGLPTDHTKPTSPHLAGVLAVVPMLAGKQLGHCSEGKEALTTSP
jgi:hypothetical protein